MSEEESKAGPLTRELAQQTAQKFGDAVARFALDMIHAVEWCCMDILQLPYEWRHLFMTPNEFPPGETLVKVAFDQMRIQTVRYIGERNKVPHGEPFLVIPVLFTPVHPFWGAGLLRSLRR